MLLQKAGVDAQFTLTPFTKHSLGLLCDRYAVAPHKGLHKEQLSCSLQNKTQYAGICESCGEAMCEARARNLFLPRPNARTMKANRALEKKESAYSMSITLKTRKKTNTNIKKH